MAYNAETLSFEVPDTDTVYVSGLTSSVTEADIAAHFGSIGVLKQDKKAGKPKIWLYRDKATGGLKGDGTVAYEDPFSAGSAVQWFNGKEFQGSTLTVSLASRPEKYGGGGGGYGGGSRGGGGYGGGSRGGGGYGGGGGGGGGGYRDGGGGYGGGGGGRDRGGGGYGGREDYGRGGGGGGGGGGYSSSRGPPQQDYGSYQQQGGYHQQGGYDQQGGGGYQQQGGGYQQAPPAYGGGGGGGGGYAAAAPPGDFGGGGGGGPPRPKEGREGDWPCPGCGNTNFAFRVKCNRCGTGKPNAGGQDGGGGGGGIGRGDGGRGRGRGRVAAVGQGPPGLFAPEDWVCSGCGNTNWARRSTCNMCNTPKPGTVDTNREGQAGGFKEYDASEIEEARRRRQEKEASETLDEFGRVKKAHRSNEDRKSREEAALARLHGGAQQGRRSRSRSPSYRR